MTQELKQCKKANREILSLLTSGYAEEIALEREVSIQGISERERKIFVARLYQDKKKTLRQCAELLQIDLEQMIDVLREFRIPFHHDDIAEQLKTARKLAREMQAATQ